MAVGIVGVGGSRVGVEGIIESEGVHSVLVSQWKELLVGVISVTCGIT